MTLFFHQTATRVRPGVRYDRAGTPYPDWSEGIVVRLALEGVNITPRASEEDRDASGQRVVTGWWLQTAPGRDADILASDRIDWDGLTLEVEGEPARWPDPFTGAVHHVKVALKRAR